MIAWDNDITFGERATTDSIYSGEQANANQGPFFTWWKTYFFRVFRTEHYNRIQELNETLFHPDVLHPMLQSFADTYDAADAANSATPLECDAATRKVSIDEFIDARYLYIKEQSAP